MLITSHATNVGDHATAWLMTEAFSRLALVPSGTADGAATNDRRHLEIFALALIDTAYPRLEEGADSPAVAPDLVEDSDPNDVGYINDLLAEFDALLNSDEGVH